MDTTRPRVTALIVAAGRGTRAGGDVPKQWRDLAGRSVAEHTIARFAAHPGIDEVILVVHPDDLARVPLGVRSATGGATRAASVRAGLAQVTTDRVLIHDVARPALPIAVIDRVLAALDHGPAAAPALPVTDALWRGRDRIVTGLQDREGLWRAQTPQGFHTTAIRAAHDSDAGRETAADDVEVARRAGLDVTIVTGDEANLKITGPEDFARAERALRGGMDLRVGNGFDVHAFGPGDHVILCGIRIPHHAAMVGHSDADVGMHAVTDAIYGALAEGDIGRHFPPSDPQWKGAASHIFLDHAASMARQRGFSIGNVDLTLICERPKIGPHAPEMKRKMARLMAVDEDRVSIKATTSERLGFTGREEGIAALATVTLVRA
ncbi:MAG: bifunctional 2-C-methyl-D-erythritol 4-phosphate cytidylyltransferase/2-C-methyl-D-erythritol 2,4-cyclodiphosphate synthase [Shimia sp.]